MKQQLTQVSEFLKKFEIPCVDKPTKSDPAILYLRCKHIVEEVRELVDAETKADTLDALVDILYLTLGTAIMFGYGQVLEEAFDRVHDTNMKKVRLSNGSEIKLKIGKDVGWKPPQLKDLVDES